MPILTKDTELEHRDVIQNIFEQVGIFFAKFEAWIYVILTITLETFPWDSQKQRGQILILRCKAVFTV